MFIYRNTFSLVTKLFVPKSPNITDIWFIVSSAGNCSLLFSVNFPKISAIE